MTTEPTHEAAFFSTIRSWGLVRSDRRVMGGVLAGVGQRIGLAAGPARLIFVLIAIFTGGFALVLYAAAWALLPDSEGRIVIQDFGRGRPNVGALVMVGILAVLGLIFLNNRGLFRRWGSWDGVGFAVLPHVLILVIPLLVLAGIVWLIVWAVRSSRSPDRAAHGYARLPDGTIPQAPASPVVSAAQAPVPDAVVTAPAEPATASGTAAPPVYTAPPRPRVPGPGKVGYLLALALIPITIGITLYLHTSHQLAAFPVVVAGVIFVAGLGGILVITALRGRKMGFLGFVSIVALIPVGIAIGTAPQLREHYAAGDWREWVDGWGGSVAAPVPEEVFTPEPAFDPSSKFGDYETVAINASCYQDDYPTPDVEGTVRLSAVTGNQTVEVTSNVTRLVVPKGTSLRIEVAQDPDMPIQADISWPDRGVSCTTTYGASKVITLTNSDAPVLTVSLADTQYVGSMSLWIEEVGP